MHQGHLSHTLPDLIILEDIERLAAQYEKRHGRPPINVSHWDPSNYALSKLRQHLRIPKFGEPMRYRYSYELSQRADVARKLGFAIGARSVLLTENGTTSVMVVANWLKLTGIHELILFCPFYFIVPYNFIRLGINVRYIYLIPSTGGYRIPADLTVGPGQALWITNPVYSTGVYLGAEDGLTLLRAMDSGAMVVADECLGIPPSRFAVNFGAYSRFLGVYTPHKALCINALKFSAVVSDPSHEDSFDHWADVLCGGLGLSAVAAIDHFCSDAYEDYRVVFLEFLENARVWHNGLMNSHDFHARLDDHSIGHFVTTYFPRLPATLGSDRNFIARTLDETGAVFIPGTRSSFDPKLGFCFRVNLAQDSPLFRAAVVRLYSYLGNLI